MIGFFRKIRKQLFTENKVRSYLLYALGEIILVVIGIMIALQINNWNEDRIDRRKENYYLNSVKTSIALSQEELDRVIRDAERISSSAQTLFQLLASGRSDELMDYHLDSLVFSAGDYSLISLNDGGIREILNTGSLDLIRDENIRIILASWDERLHKLRKFENESELLSRDYINFIRDFYDFRIYELDSLASAVIPEKRQVFLSDPRLANFLDRIKWVHRDMHHKYSLEKKELGYLDSLIDASMNR